MTGLRIGYAAMLEQFHPTEAVALAAYAESKGFSGVMAADHFQPWVPAAGAERRSSGTCSPRSASAPRATWAPA